MRIKEIKVGDEMSYGEYDMLVIDEDEVADHAAMLAYCKKVRSECPRSEFPPMLHIYGSKAGWKVDQTPYENHCCVYYEKQGDEKCDLERSLVRAWAERDREAENHIRSLFGGVGEREGRWAGTILIASSPEDEYDIEITGLGVFRLQGKINFKEHVGRAVTVTGKITQRREKYRTYENLIQILEVESIDSVPWNNCNCNKLLWI